MAQFSKRSIVIAAVVLAVLAIILWCSCSSTTEGMENIEGNTGMAMNMVNQNINLEQEQGYMVDVNADGDRRTYKHSSYALGDRDQDLSQLSFFDQTTPIGYNDDPMNFMPTVEGDYAQYFRTKEDEEKYSKPLTLDDKFNISELLPKDTDKDWFDNPYDTLNVKSSHLINIHRPIGVNTVQSSLKNGSRDIRGTPPNPKFAVSPWMNSSIDPDTNIKGNLLL